MTQKRAKELVVELLLARPGQHAVSCTSAVKVKRSPAVAVYACSETELPLLYLVDDDMTMEFKCVETLRTPRRGE